MKKQCAKKVNYLFIDLETKSTEPIENGATRYFADKNADWLICSTIHNNALKSLVNFSGILSIPDGILDFRGTFVAHNWFFEWSFFNQFYPGTRAADYRNWLCTAAMARWFGIAAPRAKLEEVAQALHIGEKMPEGKGLIAKYSIPQKDGSFKMCADPEDQKKFVEYCESDVVLSKKIFEVFDGKGFNVEEFRASQAIDKRGVPVDVKAAEFLVKRKERDKANATIDAEKIAGRTAGGALVLSSSAAFVDFLKKKFAVELPDARQPTIDAMDFSNHPKIKEIENVLYIRKLLSSRAGDKAELILNRAHNNRVHNATVFHAAGTGRYQSWGINLFNFSRQSVEDWEKEKETAPVPALQRGIVCAPKGKALIESDWRGIENYLSLYYANDVEQLARIEAGELPYLIFGEKLYGEKITKKDGERYTFAKIGVLGSGYGAGANKLGAIYNLDFDTAKKIVNAWRAANAPIVKLWYNLFDAFKIAAVGREASEDLFVKFYPLGNANDVKMILPDGHVIYYRNITVGYDSNRRIQIARAGTNLHGGLLLENACQAICARLLYRALVACEKEGLEVVLHVYDSIVIESVTKDAKKNEKKLREIMCRAPEWAAGFKLAVDVHAGKRWKKW